MMVPRTLRPAAWLSLCVSLALMSAPAADRAGAETPLAAQTAKQIIAATGVRGGLVVHVGCGDPSTGSGQAGKLTAALLANDSYLVHGLDTDAANVAKAREHIRKLALYGKVSVDTFDGKHLPYADNLVNLLVADELGGVTDEEVMRVLAPLGVAYVGGKKTVKPRPKEMDEWTHFRHGPEGNMVSGDTLVGPPRHVQWVCGPLFQRHHGIVPSITTVVSSGGRMFYMIDEAPMGLSGMPDKWRLVARDAFNGVLLWKRPMADWGSRAWSYWTEGHAARFNHPLHVRKRLVAVDDRVYLTLGFNSPVTAIDAATGKTVMTYEGTDYTDEFVLRDGVLYLAVNDKPQKPWPGKGVAPEPPAEKPKPSQKHIWAVNAATGTALWKAGPFLGNASKLDRLGSMRHLNLTVGAKGAFLIDERDVVGLDLRTGKERWRIKRLRYPVKPRKPYGVADLYHKLITTNTHTVIYHNDILYVMHPAGFSGYKSAAGSVVQALSPQTGKELWRHEAAAGIAYLDAPDMFGIGRMIWITDRKAMTLVALDAATGKVDRTISIKKALNVGHHHRCYPNRASVNYAILGRRGAEFVDLASGEVILHHWARGGCRYGHMLANGLFYRPPDFCRCYMAFQPRGFFAMTSEKAAGDFKARLAEGNALEKGPAYGKVAAPGATYDKEWPTYRHDPMRSGSATTDVPASLKQAWQVELGKELTPPVVAGGKVFCATQDDHRVHALDAATGKRLWSFTAGGRVDSPPTIHAGLALFGCRDGWVYCLSAADGKLVWRFRAAPGERRIVAFGQVESVWPVHGSVLVADGKAYFVAGRSSFLDGGVYAYAVDVKTGKLVERKKLAEVQTDTRTSGQLPRGALPDILTTNGEGVYLGSRRLDFSSPVGNVQPAALAALKPLLTAGGGFFNKRWFHRAFWRYGSRRGRATGNLIVFDEQRAYVAAANAPGNNNKSFHIPAGGYRDRLTGVDGRGPSWLAKPNLQYGGCLLFATGGKPARKTKEPDAKGIDAEARKRRQARAKKNRRASQPPAPASWSIKQFPLCPWAMVAAGPSTKLGAGKTLFVAGFLDRMDPKDPWANFEGRGGGSLYALSAEDGKKLTELKLDSPPVWNGMAAANGRLYIATRRGKMICFGKQ